MKNDELSKLLLPQIAHVGNVCLSEESKINLLINMTNIYSKNINFEKNNVWVEFNTINDDFIDNQKDLICCQIEKTDIETLEIFKNMIQEKISQNYSLIISVDRSQLKDYNNNFRYPHLISIVNCDENKIFCNDFFKRRNYETIKVDYEEVYNAFVDNEILNADFDYFKGIILLKERNEKIRKKINYDKLCSNICQYLQGGQTKFNKFGIDVLDDIVGELLHVRKFGYIKYDVRSLSSYIAHKEHIYSISQKIEYSQKEELDKYIKKLHNIRNSLLKIEHKNYLIKDVEVIEKNRRVYVEIIKELIKCKKYEYKILTDFLRYLEDYIEKYYFRFIYVGAILENNNIKCDDIGLIKNKKKIAITKIVSRGKNTFDEIITDDLIIEKNSILNVNKLIIRNSLKCFGEINVNDLSMDKKIKNIDKICAKRIIKS